MFRSRNILVFLLVMLLVASFALFGCQTKKTEKSSSVESEKQESESVEKILAIGEKDENKAMAEVAVTKIAPTQSLTSTEAAVLKKGVPGESDENTEAPKTGNEFLLVTFTFKGKEDKTRIFPNDVKLEDADKNEIKETETNGHGGLFNMDMIAKGEESTVTAVYEVAKGSKDLVLVYQPYGDKILKFKIR